MLAKSVNRLCDTRRIVYSTLKRISRSPQHEIDIWQCKPVVHELYFKGVPMGPTHVVTHSTHTPTDIRLVPSERQDNHLNCPSFFTVLKDATTGHRLATVINDTIPCRETAFLHRPCLGRAYVVFLKIKPTSALYGSRNPRVRQRLWGTWPADDRFRALGPLRRSQFPTCDSDFCPPGDVGPVLLRGPIRVRETRGGQAPAPYGKEPNGSRVPIRE